MSILKILGYSLVLAVSFGVSDALACSCGASGKTFFESYLNDAIGAAERGVKYSNINVIGKVLSYKKNSMQVEVEFPLNSGLEKGEKIRVWGDIGHQCRPYVNTFEIGKSFVWRLGQIENPLGPEPIGDYVISICGVYWLEYEPSTLTFTGKVDKPEVQKVHLAQFIKGFDDTINEIKEKTGDRIAFLNRMVSECTLQSDDYAGVKFSDLSFTVTGEGYSKTVVSRSTHLKKSSVRQKDPNTGEYVYVDVIPTKEENESVKDRYLLRAQIKSEIGKNKVHERELSVSLDLLDTRPGGNPKARMVSIDSERSGVTIKHPEGTDLSIVGSGKMRTRAVVQGEWDGNGKETNLRTQMRATLVCEQVLKSE